mmetsp:Transcript_3582/g.9181  ORF Transcript_3582/g.9181 Transcript_3582/m.9181 type:complete len:348 (-) Transcript_3582:90-1133(-)
MRSFFQNRFAQPFYDFLAFERAFQGEGTILFTREHSELPIFAVSVYLLFVFSVPVILKKPFRLKTTFAMWNLFLSVFSIIGTTRIVPHLYTALKDHGFRYTICNDPKLWYSNGPVGVWMALFIYSKIPELLDTVFLVLRKKQVIFLHWFHHVTVLLYCWHSLHTTAGPGIWFAAMNFMVHSIMYFYFFMTNIGFYAIMQPFAPFITTIQILQMIGGIICLTGVAHIQLYLGEKATCDVNSANWKLGLMMYFSYFVLFAVLFLQKYVFACGDKCAGVKKPRSVASSCPAPCPELHTTDASGFFHPSRQLKSREELQTELAELDARRATLQRALACVDDNSTNGVKKHN